MDKLDKENAVDKLASIYIIISELLKDAALNQLLIEEYKAGKTDILKRIVEILEEVQSLCLIDEIKELTSNESDASVILSCDASIKKNPGGPAAVGVVIEKAGKIDLISSYPSPATTNNQAEYDAIYFGLTQLFSLNNNPGPLVEVRSDSRIVISQLNKTMECNDPKLKAKRDMILELVAAVPSEIRFVWKPRNSTKALTLANNAAQDEIGVPNH